MRKQHRTMVVILSIIALVGCKKKESAPPQDTNQPGASTVAIPAGGTVEEVKATPAEPITPAARDEAVVTTIPSKIGDRAWALEGLEFVKGEPVKIEPGKVYVVEFWATWCPPCRRSIPHLTEVAHKYKDKKVAVVGISNESVDVVKPFVEQQAEKMDYHVAVDPTGKVNQGYMRAFNQGGIPHAFIVDATGKIAWHGHPMANIEEVLDGVLAGTFDATAYAKRRAAEQAQYEANVKMLQAYFQKASSGATEEARAIVDDWIDEAPASMLNGLAWDILTKIEEDNRDNALALRAAEKANTLTDGNDPAILDTYGLALFVNGKVQEAIGVQEKAVELAKGDPRMAAEFGQRLEQFKAAAGR